MIRLARNFILLHLTANALLLWLAYKWLGIDESSGAKLVWSALDALAILALSCWLYGATIVYFRCDGEARMNSAFGAVLRHIGLLIMLAIAAMILYGLVARWASAADEPPFNVASWLTMRFRKPVRPATISSIYHACFWTLRWVVIPVLLLPVAAGLAKAGWRGWRESLRKRGWRDWIYIPVILVAGLWLPLILLGWRPHFEAFGLEMLSFLVRGAVAYLLFVGAILGLTRHLGRAAPTPS